MNAVPSIETQREELTRQQKAIRDAAELADRPTLYALELISQGRGFASSGGIATARCTYLQAIEQLQKAVSYLPAS